MENEKGATASKVLRVKERAASLKTDIRNRAMTKRLREALKCIEALPEARQDEIAEMLLDLAGRDAASAALSGDQWAEIRRRMCEPREYASDAEVEAYFKRHGL